MSLNQSFEIFNHDCNEEEEERELEEALSLSDLPICSITLNEENDDVGGVKDEENKKEEESLDIDFDFSSGSQFGSISGLEGEMCAADEVFSGGLMLPYRNSVSSMSGLRSVSRSESMDRRTFGSRSSSSRSSSIRSHYSATSSGSSSSGSSNITAISAKTVPLVSKSSNKVVQNKFHSYPSPKPQILGTDPRFSAYAASPVGKKSKMWDVLKLGLVRTPEIELQDLKLRHHRTTNNFGKPFKIPRNNSAGSNSSNDSNKGNNNNNDRPRKSYDFVSEMQRRKNQLHEINNNNNNGGFFKSCKCTIGVIEPMPTTPNYRSNKFGKSQILNEDKNSAQKKLLQEQQKQQQQQQQQRRNNQIRQGKKVMSHHHQQHNHDHHRTFEWLKNLSHASILNNSSIKF